MSSRGLALVFALLLAGTPAAEAQRGGSMRFQGMDRNGDGVITRDEWAGNARSFALHDWNGDGVLSGDEVRPRGRRQAGDRRGPAFDDREDAGRFADLDVNRDGRITRDEWRGARANFDLLDDNRDGAITREEIFGESPPAADDLFSRIDVNRDGAIARGEWPGSAETFARLDADRDGRLTHAELSGSAPQAPRRGSAQAPRSQAYEAGYERGLVEGRQAGREDRERNQGWDLEGQRELEQADSGYLPSMGSRADYQAGYREAFRLGYREGWRSAAR